MHVFFVQYQHDPRTVKQVCYAADNMTHAIQLFNSEYCGLFEVVGCIYGWKRSKDDMSKDTCQKMDSINDKEAIFA